MSMSKVSPEMSMSKAGWERLRQVAARICREHDREEELDTARRNWICKTWPCPVRPGAEEEQTFLGERFTPEWPHDLTSEHFIRNCVRRSFNEFLEDDHHFGVWIRELSDFELVRALPFLVRGLNIRALQEVLSNLSTCPLKKAMNRGWLESRIAEKLLSFSIDDGGRMAEPLQQVIAIVRNEKSARKYSPAGFLSDLPSLPTAAAEMALTKLDKLSLQTLRVMYEVICNKPPSEVSLLKAKYCGNKERYINSIKARASAFVQETSLPPILQKTLLVMSLSARATVGEDGNLRLSLDKQYRGPEGVQDQMLLAHSRIDHLEREELETAYLQITEQIREDVQTQHGYFDINSGSKRESHRKHPNDFKQSLRRILFGYIIRSGILDIPVHVIQAVGTINAATYRKQSHKSQKGSLLLKLKQQFDKEVASLADFSSQLRDLIVDGCGLSGPQDFNEIGAGEMFFSRVEPKKVVGNEGEGSDSASEASDDLLDMQFYEAQEDVQLSTGARFHSSPAYVTDTGTILGGGLQSHESGESRGDKLVDESSPVHGTLDSSCSNTRAKQGSKKTCNVRRSSLEQSMADSEASSVGRHADHMDEDIASGSDSEDSVPLVLLGDDLDMGYHEAVDSSGASQVSQSLVVMMEQDRVREEKMQRIADKAAVLMYTFIGRAMEAATARPESALLEPAQKYLAAFENIGVSEPDLGDDMLLKIVETLPAMPKRAREAVKRRISSC